MPIVRGANRWQALKGRHTFLGRTHFLRDPFLGYDLIRCAKSPDFELTSQFFVLNTLYLILNRSDFVFLCKTITMNSRESQLKAFDRLLTIMDELRSQCPWDKKQTMQSLRHLTIEETYELGDAILDNNLEEIKKELGDVLLHIVFYAKIGSETK